jgi:hypothetical protein
MIFTLFQLKRGCIVCATNNCDQTYLGAKTFHGKTELAIYNVE